MDDFSSSSLNLQSLRTRFALNFLRALKNINNNSTLHDHINNNDYSTTKNNKYGLIVKVAADASLASAVGPRRAWSRAMLFRIRPASARSRRRRREQLVMRRRRHQRRGGGSGGGGRAEELRRLVPGGEDMDLQRLLDETAHYVKCLATQVNVMRSIVNCCSN